MLITKIAAAAIVFAIALVGIGLLSVILITLLAACAIQVLLDLFGKKES